MLWSLKPVARPSIPTLKRVGPPPSPIDAFVLQRLDREGFTPSPPADRRTLLRRVYFDLIGLPPPPEAMQAFLSDPAPDAYEKVVDRLLASPQYGERWGRHWLDLVRYAETNGYERDGPKPNAWKYRDYVIRSFNEDKPFDRFLTEQLAGDEIDGATNESRIATGYYRLGLWDDEPGDHLLDRFDQLDDVMKTTSNVFMGLTVNCARCHDHKFDPITQTDYYRMLSFFTPSKLGTEPYPNGQHKQDDSQIVLADPDEAAKHAAATAKADEHIAAAKKAVDERREAIKKRLIEARRAALTEEERRAFDTPGEKRTPEQKPLAEKARKVIDVPDAEIEKGATPDEMTALAPLKQALATAETKRPAPLPTTLGITDVGPDPPKTFLFTRGNPRTPAGEVQPGYPAILSAVAAPASPDSKAFHTVGHRPVAAAGAQVARDPAPTDFHATDQRSATPNTSSKPAPKGQVTTGSQAVAPTAAKAVKASSKPTPNESVTTALQPVDPIAAKASGDPAPKGVRTTGRRLQFARWLADPRNPLTARVMANRIWASHFGEGIVRTMNDFGTMGDRPTHPELLDYLASRFVKSGWRLKPLHREILLSSTYRQSSRRREGPAAKDPLNRMLWRMNYRRLEAEPTRDAILAVSGSLNPEMFGPSVYPKLPTDGLASQAYPAGAWGNSDEKQARRRTVYVYIKRSLQLPMLEAFDAADPNAVCPRRNVTTVAPQALALMNDPFVREEAAQFAERTRKEAGGNPAARIDRAFHLAFGRAPSSAELARAAAFLDRQRARIAKEKPTTRPAGAPADLAMVDFCQALFAANEFVYVD